MRDIWRGNPWWAKVLLAVGVMLFLLEATGVVDDVGLAALDLTAIAFVFSMNRALGEMSSTLEGVNSSLERADSRLEGANPTLVHIERKL